jgi:hypothetical protein
VDSRPVDVERMRREVLDWYRVTRAMYHEIVEREAESYVSESAPEIQHERSIRFGNSIAYLGYSMSAPHVRRGGYIEVVYHFHVLTQIPEGYRFFTHGWDGTRRYTWDHIPVRRLHPMENWRAGQYVSDPHRIRVIKNWRSDKVVIRGGFWRPGTGRLPTTPESDDDAPVFVEIPVIR